MFNDRKRFTHDCRQCVWLGQWEEYDLYAHKYNDDWISYMTRYGDEDWQYHSWDGQSAAVSWQPAVREAYQRYKLWQRLSDY